ncbi:MAG: hypothetical protein AAF591_01450 [Verrucomicrobiota bacterium]
MLDKSRVLFVCTGNIYRSRFAEALFNFHARALRLDWFASSRGLRTNPDHPALSDHAREALLARNITLHHTANEPAALNEIDLENATITIALKETEHLPMMLEKFPQWAGRIQYWQIHDIEDEPAAAALPKLEEQILHLLQTLAEEQTLSFCATPASEF